MYSKLCCAAFLFVVLFTGISEAKEKPDLMQTINKSPLCYALSEFKSHYVKDWKDDLGTLYTNYSNASYFLQFLGQKINKTKEVSREISSNTAAIMFNEAATEKRMILLDYIVIVKGDPISIRNWISDAYEKAGCSRLSKRVDMEEYQIAEEITKMKSDSHK